MKPGEVILLGKLLTDAIKAEDEDTAALTAIELLVGAAVNLALIAHNPVYSVTLEPPA